MLAAGGLSAWYHQLMSTASQPSGRSSALLGQDPRRGSDADSRQVKVTETDDRGGYRLQTSLRAVISFRCRPFKKVSPRR